MPPRTDSRDIILASGSVKRAELLEKIGIPFRVVVSGCDEDMSSAKDPKILARKLSQEKARCVAKKYPRALIIAADTFGVTGKILHGKPKNRSDATRMLRHLSGRMHKVITGVTVIDGEKRKEHSFVAVTKVWFRPITPRELTWYVDSRDWEGKGAGYTLLGRAGMFIERVDGEPGTILGLPLCALVQTLKKFGITF
ncbi:septum formation protein Maf [Candidatus Uhrbacteria bacterium]|nr:septum formation protein Maf [Candidatus Uhrbacteria bacterium]